ncbi:MAG: RNHCP domain-containing protein [Candidatus Yanofskybacteria bacterium]|nr:RNHCP domain-containing protein [Candidatus Yanofskybacteria bacterium]
MRPISCVSCKKPIPREALGTAHRNHCPFCLWSKHVDEHRGDRKAACQGLMEPVGLALKKDGELMIVHQCGVCQKVSKNRIAGDDEESALLEVQEKGMNLSQEKKELLQNIGIILCEDRAIAEESLWGK